MITTEEEASAESVLVMVTKKAAHWARTLKWFANAFQDFRAAIAKVVNVFFFFCYEQDYDDLK